MNEPGIKKYTQKGQELYRVRIARRSSLLPTLVVEKTQTGIKTYVEARKVRKKLITIATQELAKKEVLGKSWGKLVHDWSKAVSAKDIFAPKLSVGTLKEYLSVLETHVSHWEFKPVGEIDKREAWMALSQVEEEVSRTRRIRLRTAIDSVFRWGIATGNINASESPTAGYLSSVKADQSKLPEILRRDEIERLLLHAQQVQHPWYEIWALALLTGMRSGELYALEWNHIDLEKKVIFVHRNWTNVNGFGPTKGRRWRTVPIDNDDALMLLKRLRAKNLKSPFVLPRMQAWTDGRQAKILRTFCEGIGIPSIRFHSLRACFATQLISNNVSPGTVMAICGWEDLKTMQRYIRLAGLEVKGATRSLKILPPAEEVKRVVQLFSGSKGLSESQ